MTEPIKRRFQIFATGLHTSSSGRRMYATDGDLKATAEEYNARQAIDPAPLYIGHPQTITEKPHKMGIIERLDFSDGKLYAIASISDDLFQKVKSGALRAVSSSFNELRNIKRLDHVAFLNNPALKHMEPLNFMEHENYYCFEQEINPADFGEPQLNSRQAEAFKNLVVAMKEHFQSGAAAAIKGSGGKPKSHDERATEYAKLHGVSYEEAARMTANDSGGHADFSETSQSHHQRATEYALTHGVSYEEAAYITARQLGI